jgi:2-oxoglutarate dehydrogenase E1 component
VSNLNYIEQIYVQWKADPASVGSAWDAYFRDAGNTAIQQGRPPALSPAEPADGGENKTFKQGRVNSLLWAYRDVGYIHAKLNPLGGDYGPAHSYLARDGGERYEELTLDEFGLSESDLDTVFNAGRVIQPPKGPLRDILAALRDTYCRTVGAEFLHIQDKTIRRWLIHKMESTHNRPTLDAAQRRTILRDLIRTEAFEKALHRYFVGQKRFSLEGSEAVVPALHFLVDSAGRHQGDEIAIGTTHRGRLSLLNTILHMTPEEIFWRFEESHLPDQSGGGGDVKYHIGYDTYHRQEDGSSVHMRIPANASHLESIDGVLEGLARGLQERRDEPERSRVLPVLLHGDAAFSGQGVVAETLNLSRLEGYTTGGTIHIVINNQIGFTTSARSLRSSIYPTDAAKALQTPVFHVNGDDPEAVVHVVDLAIEYRQKFARDVVIDIFCYRRHGHNEGDDPSFTHPYMYRLVKDHPGVATLYADRCVESGVLTRVELQDMIREHEDRLKQAYERSRHSPGERVRNEPDAEWKGLDAVYSHKPTDTGVPGETLRRIGRHVTQVPEGFHPHARLLRILETKRAALDGEGTVDWAMAETMAFGSLLLEGTPVRLSGEDSVRGTFSQRHLAWWDVEAPEKPRSYTPLETLSADQARFQAMDSPLSEYAVLAFDYGYSVVRPRTLVCWEAQFGDFANGAQVTVDNYIASAESKWGQRSGLVLLLPHGSEGQGPDHSSARLERFLQLCAENNMEVCSASTPAQYFHLLRRQMKRPFRKPLVVMTPKSLLRHPKVISPLGELAGGSFQEVLDDARRPSAPTRLLLCSGKVYYDLDEGRASGAGAHCAIVRIEQLYPFPAEALKACLHAYPSVRELVWVQEEPQNCGAWRFVREHLEELAGALRVSYLGRPASASSATGLHTRHERDQAKLVAEALQIEAGKDAGSRH